MRLAGFAFAAVALGMLLPGSGAQADVISSWDFTGTLSTAIDGSTSVSGSFTLDQTTDALTAFDFSIPGGTVSAADGWLAAVADFNATSPLGTFGVFGFADLFGSDFILVFDTPLATFDGDLYTGGISAPGQSTVAELLCIGRDADCGGGAGGASTFSSGAATAVTSTVPEPASWSLLVGGLIGLGWLRRRKAQLA